MKGLNIMATSTPADLIAKQWSSKFFRYGLQNMFFSKFIGKRMDVDELPANPRKDLIMTSPDAMIQVVMDLAPTNEKGDTITFPLIQPMTGHGLKNGTLEGAEEDLTARHWGITVFDWGHATKDGGQLMRQQAAFNWDPVARNALAMWHATMLDQASYCSMAGLGFADDVAAAIVTASLPSRKLVCGTDPDLLFNAVSTDAALEPDWYFSLEVVSYARRIACASEPIIRPLRIDGADYYLMFISPLQAKALKGSSAWKTLQQSFAAVRGSKNPMFTGMLGIWDGVILYEYQRTQTRLGDGAGEDLTVTGNTFDTGDGVYTATTAARAIFAGCQACVHAYASKPNFVRKNFDYEDKHGYAVRMLAAVGRPEFNYIDHGVMTVDTACLPD